MYYVYEYRHPITKVPFYVGKGRNSRATSHLRGSHNDSLNDVIQKLRDNGLEPEIEKVFSSNNENSVLNVEHFLINSYGIRNEGGLLCNTLKCVGSNSKVHIPEDVINLLGKMTDRDVAQITGYNWSTLRDFRRANGIESFKSKNLGKDDLKTKFRKDNNIYTIYSCNGDSETGNRYELADKVKMTNLQIDMILRCNHKHVCGWSLDSSIIGEVTKYTKMSVYNYMTGSYIRNVTYQEFADKTGFTKSTCSNLYRGYIKSLKGYVMEGNEYYRPPEKHKDIIKIMNEKTEDILEGFRSELEVNTELTSGDITNLLKMYQRTSKGWRVISINGEEFNYERKRNRRK